MEHLCYEGKLGELGLFSLEQLWGDLNVALQSLKEPQERWRETLQGPGGAGEGGMSSHWHRAGLDWILGGKIINDIQQLVWGRGGVQHRATHLP